MPPSASIKRAQQDKREGKAPTTQAGEFVREEMREARAGKSRVRNPKQAIAIGLSKARRAGVKLPPPPRGKTSERTRKQAQRDTARGQHQEPGRRGGRALSRTPAPKRPGHSGRARGGANRTAASRRS